MILSRAEEAVSGLLLTVFSLPPLQCGPIDVTVCYMLKRTLYLPTILAKFLPCQGLTTRLAIRAVSTRTSARFFRREALSQLSIT